MILDHQSTRLFADHGRDWSDALVRTVAGPAARSTPASPHPPETTKDSMPSNFGHAVVRSTVGALGAAVFAGLLFAGAAAAAPATEDNVRVQTVSYADLDMSKPQGRATLKFRIRAAARAVCDIGYFGSADQWLRLAERRCYDDAVKHARRYVITTAER